MKNLLMLLLVMLLLVFLTGCPDISSHSEDNPSQNEVKYYTLAVDCQQGSGTGAVLINPLPGDKGYEEGTVVTLTAQPEQGSSFLSWSGVTTSLGDVATVTMDSDKSVECTFVPGTTYSLSLISDLPGGATFSESSLSYHLENESVIVFVYPSQYYSFHSWSDGNTDNPRTIVMDSDKTLTVNLDCTLPEWTVIAHFAIDNNIDYDFEKEVGIMADYLGTLEEVKALDSDDNINIIVYMDGCQTYDGYESPYDDGYYVLTGGAFKDDRLVAVDEVNSGSLGETEDMLKWVVNNYPGQHYLYSIFNHGGGFDDLNSSGTYGDRGIGFDDSDNDSLSHKELGQAVAYLKSLIGRNVDLFYPYACLMGGVEMAYEVRNSADYILFSEEVFPAEKWSYEALEEIIDNPSIDGETLGSAFCDSAYDYFNNTTWRDFTLSLVDLSEIDALVESLDDLALAAIADINSDSSVAAAYNSASSFTLSMDTNYYHDILSYMNALTAEGSISAEVKNRANGVIANLNNAVAAFSENNYSDAGGISILNYQWYYKNYPSSLYEDILQFGQDTSWADFQDLIASFKVEIAPDDYETDHDPEGYSLAMAKTLTVGTTPQHHSFHENDPYDVVKGYLEGGKGYMVTIGDSDDRPDIAPLASPDLVFFDSYGNYLGYSSRSLLFTCPTSGIYYIIIDNYYEQETCYTLSCAEYDFSSDSYEPDDTIADATPIGTGETQNHTIHDSDDVDYLSFTTTEGEDYTISIPDEGYEVADMYLFDADNLSSNIGYGYEGENINLSDADGGTYYIKVECYDVGKYSVSLNTGTFYSEKSLSRRERHAARLQWDLEL